VVAVGPVPAVGPVAPLEPVELVAPPSEAAGATAGAIANAAISASSLIVVRARTPAKDSWGPDVESPHLAPHYSGTAAERRGVSDRRGIVERLTGCAAVSAGRRVDARDQPRLTCRAPGT
jgi:hypothetical protein